MLDNFDFSSVESAKSSTLAPGKYVATITDVKLGDNKTGSKHLAVSFETPSGGSLTEKFHITKGALPRLQYLHEAWMGFPLRTALSGVEALEQYFKKALINPKLSKVLLVGARMDGEGRLWSQLPYTNFVTADSPNTHKDEVFEETSAAYKAVIQKDKIDKAVSDTDSSIIGNPAPKGGMWDVSDV